MVHARIVRRNEITQTRHGGQRPAGGIATAHRRRPGTLVLVLCGILIAGLAATAAEASFVRPDRVDGDAGAQVLRDLPVPWDLFIQQIPRGPDRYAGFSDSGNERPGAGETITYARYGDRTVKIIWDYIGGHGIPHLIWSDDLEEPSRWVGLNSISASQPPPYIGGSSGSLSSQISPPQVQPMMLGEQPLVDMYIGDHYEPAGGELRFRIAGNAGPGVPGGHDRLHFNNLMIDRGVTFGIDLLDGFMPEAGDSYHLFTGQSLTGGFTYTDLPELTSPDGDELTWDLSMVHSHGLISVAAADAGEDDGAPVPEPASLALFGAAGLGLLMRRRCD